MRVAICDDKSEHLKSISQATLNYFDAHHVSIDMDVFNHGFDFLDKHERLAYDLMLLDICMPGMLGTEVAKEIRSKQHKTEIIFVTTSHEFALDAFEVNAAHYLLKPFTQASFNQALDRAMHHINDKQSKMLYLKGPKGIVRVVDKNKICYVEANAHRKTVVLFDGSQFETVQTLLELSRLLEELSPNQFVTPYKGYIVNHHAILTIESQRIVLKSNKIIPIPRRTFNVVKQAYFDYMFGVNKS